MRFCKLDKGAFQGREATLRSLQKPLPWICAYLQIEPDGENDGQGGEAVLHDGKVVGSTTSVAYGHTAGKVLAFAYIKPDAAVPGTTLKVVIAGEERDAIVLGRPVYDPDNTRPRADV